MDGPGVIVRDTELFTEPGLRVVDDRDQLLRLTIDATTGRYRLHWQEDGDLTQSHAAMQAVMALDAIDRLEIAHNHGSDATVVRDGIPDLSAGISVLEGLTDRPITGFTVSTADGSFTATDWETHLEHQAAFTEGLRDRIDTVIQRSRHGDRLAQVEDDIIEQATALDDQ